ncbi:glutamine--fructose-6-phosphate transaminase (isomerizing) [Herbiconiux sp. UC225_62]|uniref:glutamine--fructose-6-phosphate transaminase (isomerizing) n=1 Tax=Herbiconiux sp. UC225_62 TaxID=3350168 RepID=UPI0036D3A9AF
MCGIVACRMDEAAGPFLIDALKLLEYRGYDSAGVAIRTVDGTMASSRTTNRVETLERQLDDWSGPALSGTGIGHTRWATHGAVTETNAHPHADCRQRVSIVHNGIIENADALRRQLEQTGHVFASEVDSEVVSHLIEEELLITGDLHSAVTAATLRLHGSWAIVALDAETGRMVAAAHRSPLLVAHSAKGVFAASDINAIAEFVDEFQAMSDGDVVELAEEFVWTRSGAHSAAPAYAASNWSGVTHGLAGHSDYMSKEIAEQPETAARIIDRLAPMIADGSLWAGLNLPPFERVAVLGCGTSLNAGRVIANAFGALGDVPNSSLIASEASSAIMDPRTLVIALSQSGETADVLRAIDDLDLGTSSLMALTNSEHSTLARRADSMLNCNAGPEIGVAATKTFVAQVITGVAMALSALAATRRIDRDYARRQTDDLRRIPDLLAHAIAASQKAIPPLIEEIRDAQGYLFLGRGAGVVYAAEGALKLKELSYRWAEHYPAGELKHGPLALVEAGTPVVVIDSGDRRIESNIAEVEARGGRVIRIGGAGSTIPALGLSLGTPMPGGIDRWGPLESVVPLQILARDLALALGRDVDKPRNLAKSVTVE